MSDTLSLRKTLRLRDLVLLGLAATIGAGIFSSVGRVAHGSGTGSVFLFIFVSITCLFCALCYAEFASRIPNAGGAYAYVYVVMGKTMAWVVGWSLILEYSVSNSVLMLSWSAYLQSFLKSIGYNLPLYLRMNYAELSQDLLSQVPHLGPLPLVINLPALLLNIAITILAYRGIKAATKVSHTSTFIKLLIIFLVLFFGAYYVDPKNWLPVLPHGINGLLGSISAVFFAFIGFDALGSTAEECENPSRDLPKAIVYTLLICLVLYSAISLVIIGMVGSENLNVADPLAFIFHQRGLPALSYIVTIASLVVIISAIVVYQIAQPRIWLSMSRNRLLAPAFSKVHPRFHTPAFATIVTGFSVGLPIIFIQERAIIDLTSVGTLFAFSFVCIGVLLLPKLSESEISKFFTIYYINSRYVLLPLLFILSWIFWTDLSSLLTTLTVDKLPLYSFMFLGLCFVILASYKQWSLIPCLGVLCCFFLLSELGWLNWVLFAIWNLVGALVFVYSKNRWKDRLA